MPVSNVFNMDCMAGMKDFPDGFFELAIVDPPYGINATNMQMGSAPNRKPVNGKDSYPSTSTAVKLKKGRLNSGGGHMKNSALVNMNSDWDFEKPGAEYFKELFRVSKNQVIWGGNYFDLQPTRCVICWDKMQPWENFSQWEMAWTSFDKPAIMIRISNTGGANDHNKIHPTQKPTKLYNEVMRRLARPGDKILDTHMGSQSSRIAAYKLDFDYWGYELDPEYFNDGNARFTREVAMPLFDNLEKEKR